jgi:uncharacterized repeat protein (TIGR02543 family)
MLSKQSKMKTFLGSFFASLLAFSGVIAFSYPAQAATVNNNNNPIAFSNATTVGANAAVGFTYRYENAVTIGSQVIDVIFSIAAKTSGGSINPVDASGAPAGATNAMINSTLNFAGSTDSVTYRLEFVEDNTTTPITLQNVAINVGDIDLLQFAQFAGITDYRLSTLSATSPTSTASVLTPQTTADVGTIPAGSYRFQSTSGGSTAEDEENWVEVRYAEVNAIEIVLGATQSGGAFFSIDFKPASWPVPAAVSVTTPTPTSYTVTYDANSADSGTAPSATTAAGSQTILGNTGTLSKSGFTFGGWNTAANGSGATYAPGSTIIPIGAVTLYALWLPNYTVTYDGNTSTGGAAPGATTAAGTQTILGNTGTLTKPGFAFAGWNTAANGSGTSYAAGSSITPTGNVTLYAVWTPAFTLTYDPNTAPSGAAPASTSGTGSVAVAPSAGTLSKPGFTFAGWNTAADGTGVTYQPGAALNLSSNITLYAMWTPVLLAETGPSETQFALTLFAGLLLAGGLISLRASRKLRKHVS